MKISRLLVFINLLSISAFSQSNASYPEFTFCGKAGGNYTLEELKECDLTLIPVDTILKITSFRISFVRTSEPMEYECIGNKLSPSAKEQLLKGYKTVFIEYVRASGKGQTQIVMKPMKISILQSN